MKSIKRKGFTLVELLIVIVVIGVLSAMMMLSSTEAVTSARASNIVSNLRNFKTAALAMYVDNLDDAKKLKEGEYKGNGSVSMDIVFKYMNNASSAGTSDSNMENYGITNKGGDGEWYVYCKVDDARVKDKLAGRAKSVGLFEGDSAAAIQSGDANIYKNKAYVGMWVVKP